VLLRAGSQRHEPQLHGSAKRPETREVVANGDIVDFGRLGTLSPSFKSKVVPVGSEFNANVHITEPRVNLRPNATYFRLRPEEVSYERMEAKPKAKKKEKKPEGST
jgi:DNA-binding protein